MKATKQQLRSPIKTNHLFDTMGGRLAVDLEDILLILLDPDFDVLSFQVFFFHKISPIEIKHHLFPTISGIIQRRKLQQPMATLV